MEKIETKDELDWLNKASTLSESVVGGVMPSSYDAFCQILPPIYLNPELQQYERPWSYEGKGLRWLTKKLPEYRMLRDKRPNVSYEFILSKWTNKVSWAELAAKRGIDLLPGIHSLAILEIESPDPIYLYYDGHDAYMAPRNWTALATILRSKGSEECFLHYETYASWVAGLTQEMDEDVLYFGTLDDFAVLTNKTDQSPTHCWPPDRSWCVFIDYDLEAAWLGGSASLIDTVMNDDFLEAIVVSPNDPLMDLDE